MFIKGNEIDKIYMNNCNIDESSSQSEAEIVVIPIEPSMQIPSIIERSNFSNSGILDEELNADDLFQHNKEWLTPDEDNSFEMENADFISCVDFKDHTEDEFNFSLSYNPSFIAHEEAIKEDDSFVEELKKVEDSTPSLSTCHPLISSP